MKRILFGFVGFVVVISMSCSLLESTEEELPTPEVSVSEEEVSQDNQPPDTPEPPPQGEDAGSGDEVAEEPAAEEETAEEPAAAEPVEETAEEPVEETSASSSESSEPVTIRGEVWADNWSSFFVGEQLVMEDSVPITTERSFNAEVFEFTASYPITLNFIAKDFKENDTGLEYIGANNQQMGDGGLIAQFTDLSTGAVVAVTSSNWRCFVIHKAPLDTSCEREASPVAGEGACGFISEAEPAGWKSPGFDDSGWDSATVHSFDEVRPKDGYDQITWDPSAEIIWTADLITDNTILCRLTVNQP